MFAFAAAKGVSLLQLVVIVPTFGIGSEWDAYATANRIPELIFTLIAGGALAHAFIPIFTEYLAQGDKDGAWRVASHVINTVFLTTFTLSVIVFVFAPWLVANVAASGFDAATQAQTVELMRLLLVTTLIFSVSGIVMGILQSHQHFLLPALAPIMFDVGILFGVVFLLRPFGVHGIALGAIIGAVLHFAIQVPGLIRFRAKWTRELGWRDPALRRVLVLLPPRVAGLGVFSLNFIIMNNIASRLGTGSVSALDWGWRLMQIPQTLVGTAMGTVIFPTLAALSGAGDEHGKRDAMSGALRFILVVCIPSAIGLVLIGRPAISLLEGGAFNSQSTLLVYSTLQAFSLGLIVHSILEVVARSFYADKDTLTPLWAALGGAAINFVLAFTLSRVAYAESSISAYPIISTTFAPIGFHPEFGNVAGLALANSLGTTFEIIVLLVLLRQRWHGINENSLAQTTLKTLIASLVMALAILLTEAGLTLIGLTGQGRILTIVQLALEIGIGAVVFTGMAALLKMAELNTLLNVLLRRKSSQPVEAKGTAS